MKTTPKDFFLTLLAMVTLYMSAASFLTLLFQIINSTVSDALEYAGGHGDVAGTFGKIRFAISSLIVVFPAYLGTMFHLEKIYRIEPERRKVGIRRWLVALTLFIAVLIIIGDFVALVNSLLGGELKVRFILKALSIMFVAGSIFFYYFRDYQRYKGE